MFKSRDDVEQTSKSSVEFYEQDNYFKCKTLNLFWIYTEKEDHGYTPHAKSDGFWESWVTYWIANNIRQGSKVLDIGANHGYYSLMLAAIGCYVVAAEPQPNLAKMINLSKLENGFTSIDIEELAYSDIDGEDNLIVPINHGMNASLSNSDLYAPFGSNTIKVKTKTLNNSNINFDFIKIDAEGAEEKIWNGAQEYLSRNPQTVIIIEWSYNRYVNPNDFAIDIFRQYDVSNIEFDGSERKLESFEDLINQELMLVLRRKYNV